ncbi:alpha-ketoglutarate-dependent dioxygenase AlkB [Dietzia cinnamea]|uniref:alpha-ketoglutarate-dependent dioxygenase AlkB family protein n=1 Tax=Dietzia cinnamea TaxID=321318 RepID=UPI0021A447FC|nr:alpha-ketoglutarate-dependent dioxygenase AlkB [Dietzia cinnamea]MCT1884091.1 alpha-ketoglutarate-dependent dioxygenase AlkB [Dietzia cinnamea]MCT2099889.1 alpha-ketoglutarate-dependent dioxygenase AlkB [Dietzia cinnamea]
MTEPLFGVHREPSLLGPGAVHVPDWMSREQQEYLLRACADWAAVAAPRSIVLPGGGRMSVRTFSLGRHWSPYRYDDDDAATPPIPDWLVRAARTALTSAAAVDPRSAVLDGGDHEPHPAQTHPAQTHPAQTHTAEPGARESVPGPAYTPDAALVNLYGRGATMGLHQDRDEASPAPVVSFSLGDACTFRFGTPEHRGRPYTDVRLESGDLVVFGGPSRMAFHGVPKVFDSTAPSWCREVLGAEPGRVNITLRMTRPPTLGG